MVETVWHLFTQKKNKKRFHTLKLWLIILASSRKVASILLHIEYYYYYYYYYSKIALLVPKIYPLCVISLSSFKQTPMVPQVLKVRNTSPFVNCHVAYVANKLVIRQFF